MAWLLVAELTSRWQAELTDLAGTPEERMLSLPPVWV